jgi:hypothetical protein
MEAMLYACTKGTLVLVPECFEPSSDLDRAHGRFWPCGRIRLDDPGCGRLCRRVLADFDRCSYSILSRRDADRLARANAFERLDRRRGAQAAALNSPAGQRLMVRSRLPENSAIPWADQPTDIGIGSRLLILLRSCIDPAGSVRRSA